MSLTAFTLFPQLPPEICPKIWEESISHTPTLLPRNPISGLEACHESRTVYLSTYTLSFYSIIHQLLEYPISLYANYELDILYIDPGMYDSEIIMRDSEEWLMPSATLLGGLRYLAMKDQLWRDADDEAGSAGTVDARHQLLRIQGLREFMLVLTSSHPMDDNEPEDGEGKELISDGL